MRQRAFIPIVLETDPRYVRDASTGFVWHRVANRVLYADTDRSGVVYHANYFRFFELGRATLLRDAQFPYREVEDGGHVYPIVELGMNCCEPLRYDDPMWVHTRFRDLERVRVSFEYVITHQETARTICHGFTIHCAVGRDWKPTEVDPVTIRASKSFPP